MKRKRQRRKEDPASVERERINRERIDLCFAYYNLLSRIKNRRTEVMHESWRV